MKRPLRVSTLPEPMLPTLVGAAFDSPEWSFETKWDGVRAICAVTAGGVFALSRTGRDLLPQFPELLALTRAFKESPVVVDGEIVSLDVKGRSSFQRLQPRINRRTSAADGPSRITYVVFDLLVAGVRDLRQEPFDVRRRLLSRCLRPRQPGIMLSPGFVGAGKRLFETARRNGLEGIVAKRRDSTYHSGRTREWLKIKAIASQEFVVGGWTDPLGSRSHFGALLLGVYDADTLTYAGRVGTGFDEQTLVSLKTKLLQIQSKRCPFNVRPPVEKTVHWVTPKLVAEIKFGEWTRDGVLRHPVYVGLRTDKRPRDCVRERPRPRN